LGKRLFNTTRVAPQSPFLLPELRHSYLNLIEILNHGSLLNDPFKLQLAKRKCNRGGGRVVKSPGSLDAIGAFMALTGHPMKHSIQHDKTRLKTCG
jgi:hypothetical protein